MNLLSESNISTLNKKSHLKIKNLILFSVIVFLCSYFLINYLIFKAYIPTGSMRPTIMEEDEVIVSKIYTSINRGDIFVFSHESSEELLIKRVVGLPGEKVEVKDGLLYVNDVFIDEPYVKNNESMNKTFYVPEGNYLFFGDNRAISEDARRWENPYVPKKNLDGKALFTVYPRDRIGLLK